MPTYKHPCPYCGKFIDKVVAACPFCAHPEPFAPKRCPSCSKIVDDPDWVACPSCGASLIAPPPTADDGTAAPGETPAGAPPAQAQQAAPPSPPPAEPAKPVEPAAPAGGQKCAGCGAPLAAGARFCTVCGTIAG